MREALEPSAPGDVEAMTDRWLSRRGRTLHLWEDEDGEVVSLAGVGSQTPNGVRIGPVYTPPEARNRGYASALVADDQPGAARCRPAVLLPVHGPRQPDLEPHLPDDRLRARARRRHVAARPAVAPRERDPTPSRNLARHDRARRHRTDTLSALLRGRREPPPVPSLRDRSGCACRPELAAEECLGWIVAIPPGC